MRKILLSASMLCLFVLCAIGASAAPTQPDFMVRNGDRVVFYGDSITDGEWYPTLVETYVLTRYPAWRNHFANRGVSGDTSGSVDRFQRDVLGQKADIFTYNMGYNDGGYDTLMPQRLEGYLSNVEATVKAARAANPKIRMLIASPIPNEVTVSADPRWVSHETYPYVMLTYGHEEAKLAQRLHAPFVDTGLLYGQTMGLGEVAAGPTFKLSRDGVHPQRVGQTYLAFYMLKGLGADPTVASVTIDAAKAKVIDAQRCDVSNLSVSGGAISFERTCDSLPYPTLPEARPFAFLEHIDDNLSADTLTVTGLPAKAYTLSIDGTSLGDIAASELADGVNLTRYTSSPMYVQAMAVFDAVRAKQVAEAAYWRQFIMTGKADGAGNPLPAATSADRAAISSAQAAIAADEAACYAINTPKPHTITLQPTTAKAGRFDALADADIDTAPLDLALTKVDMDWNAMSMPATDETVTITNSGPEPRSGTLAWSAGSGWTVTPSATSFTVGAGKSQQLTFSLMYAGGAIASPPPTATIRWPWSDEWPYPMMLTRQIEIKPHLVVAHSSVTPDLTGNLSQWKDATTFTLDNVYFVDPAAPGKKLTWGGPNDLSGQVFIKWDEAALYVAVLTRDNEHVQAADASMMWSQDSVMFGLDMPEPGKTDGIYEYAFGAYSDRDAILKYRNGAPNATGPDIRFKSHLDTAAGTCLYETVLPWDRLAPLAPASGRGFGFTLAINDADTQDGKGFNYLAWTPGINFGKNPADFAALVLGDKQP